jgi:hypothetical protein
MAYHCNWDIWSIRKDEFDMLKLPTSPEVLCYGHPGRWTSDIVLVISDAF